MYYEYQCQDCGYKFELKRSISEVKKYEKCPQCGGIAEKILTKPTVIFKGGGWADKNYDQYNKQKEIDEMAYLSEE